MAMRDEASIEVKWHVRARPLTPICAVARGRIACTLAHRLLADDEATLSQLKGVAGPELLIVAGEADALPWVDGVTYLGRKAAAPSLLLPTTRVPSVPLPLLERALLAHSRMLAPIAVLLDPPAIASMSAARAIARESLLAWLDSESL